MCAKRWQGAERATSRPKLSGRVCEGGEKGGGAGLGRQQARHRKGMEERAGSVQELGWKGRMKKVFKRKSFLFSKL